MSENQFNAATDGQEFAISDANTIGTTAGLADDRLLAELLRLTPFDGTKAYKTILPYGSLPIEGAGGASATNNGTVQPTGSANGSILIQPFRAVVGSRVTPGTSVLQNWRDIRSSVFVGPSALAQTIALAANSSGNPRWDLVYATVSIDVASGTQTKRVKNPSTGIVTVVSLTTALLNPCTITVLAGTPAGTPVIPTLPSDSGGNYNIALAIVRVPNGFSASSTIPNADIRDQVLVSALMSPTMGTARIRPATGNTDQPASPTYGPTDASGPGYWNPATSGQRPGVFMPPGWIGGDTILIAVDLTVSGHPSHAISSVVDDSVDWRNRIFKTIGCAGLSGALTLKFAMDNTAAAGAGSGSRFPNHQLGTPAIDAGLLTLSNSFGADATLVAGGATVWQYIGAGGSGDIPSGAQIGLYVSMADGILRWFNNGTASIARFFFWLEATGAFPNG